MNIIPCMSKLLTRRYTLTRSEGITNISSIAWACCNMIDNSTNSVYTTEARAWINTFVVSACFVSWTFWVDGTFRPACYIWISEVAFNTSTGSCSIPFITESIFSTRRRRARVRSFSYSWRCWLKNNNNENIIIELYNLIWSNNDNNKYR